MSRATGSFPAGGKAPSWGKLGKTKLKRYLLKWYGWRDIDRIISDTGASSDDTVYAWARALDVPSLFEQEGVLRVQDVAHGLGVPPNVVYGWANDVLIIHHTGYRGRIETMVFKRPEVERWLMRPKPAWMLVDEERIQDEQWRIILRNAKETNESPWIKTKEAAEKYHMSDKGLLWHARQGKIARFAARGRHWLYEPDIRRTLGMDHVS